MAMEKLNDPRMDATDKSNEPHVDPSEFSAAEEEAKKVEGSVFTHKFSKPFMYQGKSMSTLVLDFGKLTGRDGLAIESELQRAGKTVIAPAFSGEFLIRMCARASDPVVGADAFEQMSLADFNKVRSAARSFLLKSEL